MVYVEEVDTIKNPLAKRKQRALLVFNNIYAQQDWLHFVAPLLLAPCPNERYLFSGALSRIRTCDLRIRNPLLYPAEL